MKTLEYLSDPMLRGLYLPAIVAALAVALMCSVVSPLVVVKRLGFVGQGISHSAFGGIGVASVLAAFGFVATGGAGEMTVVVGFCVAAALGMSVLGGRRETPEDTAIGLYLVASMAAGAVLVQVARAHAVSVGRPADVRSWESILFGSVLMVSRAEVVGACALAVVVGVVVWMVRRPLAVWGLDEEAASAAGVPVKLVRAGLLALLAVVVVATMKVAGVVLASALVVLPGATALRLSARAGRVWMVSVGAAVAGVVGGLLLSFELSWQPGPSVALVQTGVFVMAAVAGRVVRRA